MKKNKLVGLAALALTLGMAGCGEKDNPEVEPCEKHTWGEYVETKAPTCTEKGSKERVCSVCGEKDVKDVAKKAHTYVEVTTGEGATTPATCLVAGTKREKCSACGDPKESTIAALGHAWVKDDAYQVIAATCTAKGVEHQKCSRAGCDATQIIETNSTGHDFEDVEGTPEEGYATLNGSECKKGDSTRVFWSAVEVTDHCKNDRRVVKDAEGEPGTEGYVEAVTEPNYVDNGDGSIRFWGRPIRNAIELNEEGRSSSNADHTPIYAPEIEGSFFEYKVKLTQKLTNAQLIAEYAPTGDLGTGDLYKKNNGDWTPGLTSDGQGGSKNLDFRYEIKVDADTLVFDDSDNASPGSEKAWFTFPTNAFTLEAGEHTIRISMGGGYLNSFFNFGFQTVTSTGHVHNFVKDTTLSVDPTCAADGRYYGVCSDTSCGFISDRVVPMLGHDYEEHVDSEADCVTDGQKTLTCKRDGCTAETTGHVKTEVTTALGHHYVKAADQGTLGGATCTEAGKEARVCDREGCTAATDGHTIEVDVPALGHNFVAGTPAEAEGFATVTPSECDRDQVKRISWSATDVTEATKTAKVVAPAEGVEGEDGYVPAVTEPNYVEVTGRNAGVKLWGRPIHNSLALKSDGSSQKGSSMTDDEIVEAYDATVEGSFIEYKINVPEGGIKGNLLAEMTKAQWLNGGMFSAGSNPKSDWTPGIKNAEGQCYDTRYVIFVDGVEVAQDMAKDTNAASSKTWYNVPLAEELDLTAGPHTIKFVMASGNICTFHNFAIEEAVASEGGEGGDSGETVVTNIKEWSADEVVTLSGISPKTGKTSTGEDIKVVKYNAADKSVTLTFNNEGEARDVMFKMYATTKDGNTTNCQMYRQTIGEESKGGAKQKFIVTVNGTAVEFPEADLDKSFADLGIVAANKSTIQDSGTLCDPIWVDYVVIHLAAGENTIVFANPSTVPGYSVYIGGFALAEIAAK